ncbi:MAG: hypothetical protein KatS3mg023_3753 [Armatimonadota bacterium]|nr:MAG: hypothetical protein KatS3mg023_3753 [Armatimonadota bacterium]
MVQQARQSIPLNLGPLGETVIRRTYARAKQDGGIEDWYDICARVVNGNCSLVDSRFIEPEEPQKLFHLMVTMQIIPAGRHLWATGIHKYRQFVNNCFVADFTDEFHKHFTYTFLRLMEGGGVGANYSDRFIHSNPNQVNGYWVPDTVVNLHFLCSPNHQDIDRPVGAESDEPFRTLRDMLSTRYPVDYDGAENGNYLRVDDSREGWAEALEKLLQLHLSGRGEVDFVVDVGNVRPYGAELKGFGGKASGPGALMVMLYRINRLLNSRTGTPLSSLDYMEIDHYIAQAVIAGGTRRSARMSMKWWTDKDIFEFIHCKRDFRLHWTTNISVVVDDEFFRAVRNRKHPLHGWANRVLDEVIEGMLTNGEPGFINASQCEVDEAPGATFYSTNPCVTENTLVLTDRGMVPVKELRDEFTAVYNGEFFHSSGFFSTGKKPVYEVLTVQGSRLEATADHRLLVERDGTKQWVPISDLKPGDSVVIQGAIVADDEFDSLQDMLSLLGSESSDGTEFIWLPDKVDPYRWKAHLNMLGIKSVLVYRPSLDTWSLRIDKQYMRQARQAMRLRRLNRTSKKHRGEWLEQVQQVSPLGEMEVYDCTVEGAHCYVSNGFVSHNCGEIAMMRYPDMRSFDVCCLGHVNLAFAEDPVECFRLMSRFLLRATFAELSDELTRQNVQRNRRIGVGFLGFHEWLVKHGIRYSEASSSPWVARQLRKFREVVREEARRYARQMRIAEPIKCTTVAPTGTINNIPGVTSGIQPLYSPFYIRRVRYSNSDTELQRVLERGDYHHVESAINEPNTTVVSYVCRDITVDRLVSHLGDYEQVLSLLESQFDLDVSDFLRVQELVQREYADNAVSITINISAEEQRADRIRELLLLYLPRLKGVTMFPESSRPQSPLERISREQYELSATRVQNASYEEDCSTGACPVK